MSKASSDKKQTFHSRILAIPCDGATLDWANTREAYMYGHLDARRAAAALAAEADATIAAQAARIAELEAELGRAIEHEYNPYEPDNQSARYWRMKALLAARAAGTTGSGRAEG